MKRAGVLVGMVLACVAPDHHHTTTTAAQSPAVAAVVVERAPRVSRSHWRTRLRPAHKHHRVSWALPDVWARVGRCEASGKSTANTGNGFSGLFQFTPGTWTGYGGAQFASYAWQATVHQQLLVARRVLRDQGIGAWPVCGPRAGLTPSS